MKSYMKFTLLTLVVMAALVINVSAEVMFYEDFQAGLTQWWAPSSGVSISGGVATFSNPSTYTEMRTRRTFPENTTLLVFAKVSPEKFGQGLGFYKVGNYASFFSGDGKYRFGTASAVRNYNVNTFVATYGYHLWEIDRGTDSVTFKVDGKTVGVSTTNVPRGNLPIEISANYPNREVKVDWVMVLEG